MDNEDKVLTYAMAFAMVTGGILILSLVPAAIRIGQVQNAQAFNLMADGHRMISLAKTYDAKVAAQSIKTVMSEIM
ncbi:MAG: hypothetical protein RR259_11165 [Odoribacter sp.]